MSELGILGNPYLELGVVIFWGEENREEGESEKGRQSKEQRKAISMGTALPRRACSAASIQPNPKRPSPPKDLKPQAPNP